MIHGMYGLWSAACNGYYHSVYALWFTVCMGHDSLCGLCMSDLYNHYHDDAAKKVWLSSSDKADLRHMLSGIADFTFEIVHISATGRCIRSLIFALNTFRILIQSFPFFNTLLLMPVELNYHSHCQYCLHCYHFQGQYRFVCESVHRAYSEGIVKPLPEFHRWERSTH